MTKEKIKLWAAAGFAAVALLAVTTGLGLDIDAIKDLISFAKENSE